MLYLGRSSIDGYIFVGLTKVYLWESYANPKKAWIVNEDLTREFTKEACECILKNPSNLERNSIHEFRMLPEFYGVYEGASKIENPREWFDTFAEVHDVYMKLRG